MLYTRRLTDFILIVDIQQVSSTQYVMILMDNPFKKEIL